MCACVEGTHVRALTMCGPYSAIALVFVWERWGGVSVVEGTESTAGRSDDAWDRTEHVKLAYR